MSAIAIPRGPKQRKHNNTKAAARHFGALSPMAVERDAAAEEAL
jgi:hypothetical protein